MQAILSHLLACINEAKADVAGNRARIDRCAALAASAAARAELANKNAAEAVPIAREAALEELLKVARAANEDDGPRHGPPPKRDRHGLHLVRDAAGGTAALAALFSFLRSPLARGTHRAVSLAMVGALGAAGTVAGPSLLMPSPSPSPAATVPAHHHQARRQASMLNVDPPDAPPRARHHHAAAAVPAASPTASPAASGQPAPSPTPALPVAVPTPTLPVVPPPLPSPSPTACHGKHCHGGGDLGQVLSGFLPQWQH